MGGKVGSYSRVRWMNCDESSMANKSCKARKSDLRAMTCILLPIVDPRCCSECCLALCLILRKPIDWLS
jgi:hypothetical protein